jgi:hypothetical protein
MIPMVCIGPRPRYFKVEGESMRSSQEATKMLDRHPDKDVGP